MTVTCPGQTSGTRTLVVKDGNSQIESVSVEVKNIVIHQLDLAQVLSLSVGSSYQTVAPGRDTLVRAYVYSANNPTVSLTAGSDSYTMTCPSSLPTSVPSDTVHSYDKTEHCYSTLDKSKITSGLSLTVNAAGITENYTPTIASKSGINIKVVPITVNGNTADLPSTSSIKSIFEARMPFATASVEARSAWTPSGTFDDNLTGTDNNCDIDGSPDSNGDMGCVLRQLNSLRDAEYTLGNGPVYYGLVPHTSGFTEGVVGLAYVGSDTSNSFTSIGFEDDLRNDLSSHRWYIVMLHEVGHNLSLGHAPCGSPTPENVDSFWSTKPWLNASGGKLSSAALYDQENDELIDPTTTGSGTEKGSDVMGYCDGEWFSEYNYHKIATFAAGVTAGGVSAMIAAPMAHAMADDPAPTEAVLHLSGSISEANSKATLSPVKKAQGGYVTPNKGAYILRLYTQGGALIERRFNADRVEDGQADGKHFFLTVPSPGKLSRIEILKGERVLYRTSDSRSAPTASFLSSSSTFAQKATTTSAASALDNVKLNETSGTLHVAWNHQRHPWLQLVHIAEDGSRTALALYAKNGKAEFPLTELPKGGHWEVTLSDGLNSETKTFAR